MGRTDMLKIADVLRLSEGGTLTQREISTITRVSTGTVSNILARAATAGVSWPLPDGVSSASATPSNVINTIGTMPARQEAGSQADQLSGASRGPRC